MANRKPIYDKRSADYRVISAPNGLWLTQRRISRPDGVDTRREHGWRDNGRATTREVALAQLNAAIR